MAESYSSWWGQRLLKTTARAANWSGGSALRRDKPFTKEAFGKFRDLASASLKQDRVWSDFFREHDVVISETRPCVRS